MTYFVSLGKGELLYLHWNPIIHLQAGLIEMFYTWNEAHTIERGENVEALVWYIQPPVYLLMPHKRPPLANMHGVHNQVWFLKLQPY